MDLIVDWTDNARSNLEDIFQFYKPKTGSKKAYGIVDSIIDSTIILETHPRVGQIELLLDRKEKYRYIVSGNYKVIYRIAEPYIYIVTVFDCRQDPSRLREFQDESR